ncbi:hypothetical protein, conserved [Eimeria tenella]|uniref:Uncharacterized protein n=1 Tax=Eimeria tenella TaxID=5802 RepID=U6KWH8_EIMTE|nr:hypothetical protein, conserved [Eimeria tenella]CDJ42326.1 hypothetical protein, conserved [Eimeria tenella]|eukprot:XP_013233076.1 hypothetical protein, conserved [Eimeria tenella]
MTGELDPRFLRSFRSTWEDTPSSHAVPQAALTALGLTRGDFLDVKAWIFLVARKLQFVNGERAAFKACEALAALFGDPRCFAIVQDALATVPKEDVPQVLASCCLKLTAQFESQSNEADHEDFLVGPTLAFATLNQLHRLCAAKTENDESRTHLRAADASLAGNCSVRVPELY